MPPQKSYAAVTRTIRKPKLPSLISTVNDSPVGRKAGPYSRRRPSQAGDDEELSADDACSLAGDEKFARTVRKLLQQDTDEGVYEQATVGQDGDTNEFVELPEEKWHFDLLARDYVSSPGTQQYKTLGDTLFEQMEEKRRREAEKEKMEMFTETTRSAYTKLGKFMARFRSGKLPQLLKCIPKLKNWADILWLTKPENWSCHAIREATPIFVNGLRSREVSRYLQYVVLPAVEKSIDQHQKLNLHLFETLKKSIFKSQEWIKGIYFPIILDEHCNYKRAAIINSVLAKCSITPLTAGALLVKLATLPSHSNVIIYSMVRILNKKHNLPLNVRLEIRIGKLVSAGRELYGRVF
eukprot:Gregarina_sp_Poly_1__2185@NODE_1581_length_3795_cov_120_818938_g311_i2_p1_GENE_NODE_1581_length_3795_cov_120_818938_g311_i2NODE_1581_length_3795_cov_120_818938_g311_i2_p1_ORF_typecomplete_len352_score48_40Bystin/PF05291_11/4_1e60CAMSAP_CC1/PF17095_5/0_06Bac_transf/PF02397_16/0_13_NODE_1581_length_3795_cov_120_818938_g311_i225553610